jgi:hypothetical protein
MGHSLDGSQNCEAGQANAAYIYTVVAERDAAIGSAKAPCNVLELHLRSAGTEQILLTKGTDGRCTV